MKILPDLSPIACGTPGLLQPAVTQRHIETEVAKCVGGVPAPPFTHESPNATAADCSAMADGNGGNFIAFLGTGNRRTSGAENSVNRVGGVLTELASTWGVRVHRLADLRAPEHFHDGPGRDFRGLCMNWIGYPSPPTGWK
jgi:hypothetical protein